MRSFLYFLLFILTFRSPADAQTGATSPPRTGGDLFEQLVEVDAPLPQDRPFIHLLRRNEPFPGALDQYGFLMEESGEILIIFGLDRVRRRLARRDWCGTVNLNYEPADITELGRRAAGELQQSTGGGVIGNPNRYRPFRIFEAGLDTFLLARAIRRLGLPPIDGLSDTLSAREPGENAVVGGFIHKIEYELSDPEVSLQRAIDAVLRAAAMKLRPYWQEKIQKLYESLKHILQFENHNSGGHIGRLRRLPMFFQSTEWISFEGCPARTILADAGPAILPELLFNCCNGLPARTVAWFPRHSGSMCHLDAGRLCELLCEVIFDCYDLRWKKELVSDCDLYIYQRLQWGTLPAMRHWAASESRPMRETAELILQIMDTSNVDRLLEVAEQAPEAARSRKLATMLAWCGNARAEQLYYLQNRYAECSADWSRLADPLQNELMDIDDAFPGFSRATNGNNVEEYLQFFLTAPSDHILKSSWEWEWNHIHYNCKNARAADLAATALAALFPDRYYFDPGEPARARDSLILSIRNCYLVDRGLPPMPIYAATRRDDVRPPDSLWYLHFDKYYNSEDLPELCSKIHRAGLPALPWLLDQIQQMDSPDSRRTALLLTAQDLAASVTEVRCNGTNPPAARKLADLLLQTFVIPENRPISPARLLQILIESMPELSADGTSKSGIPKFLRVALERRIPSSGIRITLETVRAPVDIKNPPAAVLLKMKYHDSELPDVSGAIERNRDGAVAPPIVVVRAMEAMLRLTPGPPLEMEICLKIQ